MRRLLAPIRVSKLVAKSQYRYGFSKSNAQNVLYKLQMIVVLSIQHPHQDRSETWLRFRHTIFHPIGLGLQAHRPEDGPPRKRYSGLSYDQLPR